MFMGLSCNLQQYTANNIWHFSVSEDGCHNTHLFEQPIFRIIMFSNLLNNDDLLERNATKEFRRQAALNCSLHAAHSFARRTRKVIELTTEAFKSNNCRHFALFTNRSSLILLALAELFYNAPEPAMLSDCITFCSRFHACAKRVNYMSSCTCWIFSQTVRQ